MTGHSAYARGRGPSVPNVAALHRANRFPESSVPDFPAITEGFNTFDANRFPDTGLSNSSSRLPGIAEQYNATLGLHGEGFTM